MKKIILVLIGIICLIAIYLAMPYEHENKEKIDMKSIVNVELTGVEGDSYVYLSYNEIDGQMDKINEYVKQYNDTINERLKMSEEEQLKEYEKLSSVLSSVSGFCHPKEEYRKLNNGDEVIIECQSDGLDILGYAYDKEFKVVVDELISSEDIAVQETTEEIPEEPTIDTVENEIIEETYNPDGSVLIRPKDINKYDFKDDYSDNYACLIVEEENLDKGIEIAREHGFSCVLVGEYEYDRESNFEVREGFKGYAW